MSEAQAQIEFFPGAVKKATEGCKSADLWKVPPVRLRRQPGFNVRVNSDAYKARVRYIADSIKNNGYYPDKPMAGYVAKDGDEHIIIVTDGHTRMDALDLAISEGAEVETVPVVTKPNGTSMEDLTVALVTGNSGQPLTPYETAMVAKRLAGYGMDDQTIAQRIGFSLNHVQNMLFLMSAPASVRKMVEEDKVSFSSAVASLREHGARAVQVLKDCLTAAQEVGKERITPKMMQKPGGGAREPKVSKPVIVRSMQWLKENKLESDERFLNFLTFLGGFEDHEGLMKVLAAKKDAKKPAEAKDGSSEK
jgi:ParB-like chromosome segregation protein Spo0J